MDKEDEAQRRQYHDNWREQPHDRHLRPHVELEP
jgi:hypothetical protein